MSHAPLDNAGSATRSYGGIEGTGGRPNLELISDYGPSVLAGEREPRANYWFQLHTMIGLNDEDHFNRLKDHIDNGRFADAVDAIMEGAVDPRAQERARKMLRVAFGLEAVQQPAAQPRMTADRSAPAEAELQRP